jgi:nucleoside-diphosphate-sugar epimerase
MAKPRALVTGAAGGIGGALVAGLAAAGYAVTGVDRAAAPGITPLDITDTAAVSVMSSGVTPGAAARSTPVTA